MHILLVAPKTKKPKGGKEPKELGCFKDTGDRAMKGGMTVANDMTTEKCITICAEKVKST